jgi:effector-binding domain-containing protein
MKSKIVLGGVLAGFLLVILASVTLANAADSVAAPQVNLAQTKATSVLYSVHKGDYKSAVQTYHRLVKLRDALGLPAGGPEGSFVYLNAKRSNNDVQLIEVQIPLQDGSSRPEEDVDRKARTLGLGTTGLKERPASTEVRVKKAPGVKDPAPLYKAIYDYVAGNNLRAVGSPVETFPQAEEIPETCEYEELATEIAVSVTPIDSQPEDTPDNARKPGERR